MVADELDNPSLARRRISDVVWMHEPFEIRVDLLIAELAHPAEDERSVHVP